jgi:hypothetical protein
MESDLFDKVLHLALVSPIGCLLRLGHEGSGFVQMLLDIRLKGRRGHCSTQCCPMVDLPCMVYFMIGLMDQLGFILMPVSG